MKRFASGFLLACFLAATLLAIVNLTPASRLIPRPTIVAAESSRRYLNGTGGTPTAPGPSPTRRPTVPMAEMTLSPITTPTHQPVTSRAIFVDQDAQIMHIYENGIEIKTFACSTGPSIDGQMTAPWVGRVGRYIGTFYAFDAYADNAWFLFDSLGQILIHSAPYTWVDGHKVYQDLDALGKRPSSHGCIRLHPDDALWLTKWNPQGAPIAISPMTRREWP